MRIFGPEPLFRDRRDAGGALAARLERYRGRDPLVLGLPRGGVVVAAEVARRLDAELDVAVARKLGSPISPELAIGAVTASGERFLNEELIRELDVSEAYLNDVTVAQQREARRREAWLRENRPPPRIAARSVIVVDDGLANRRHDVHGGPGGAEAVTRPTGGRRARGRARGVRGAARRGGRSDVSLRACVVQRGGELLPEVRADVGRRGAPAAPGIRAGGF